MFNHILLPTDGSAVSQRAVDAGIAFAREHGARVTICHSMEPLPRQLSSAGAVLPPELVSNVEKQTRLDAEQLLAAAAEPARAAGVQCDTLIESADAPHKGILDAARRNQCDAIFMGSHGRSGIAGLLLGSVARKVVSYAHVPVTIFRDQGASST